jgi:hypothetical protein
MLWVANMYTLASSSASFRKIKLSRFIICVNSCISWKTRLHDFRRGQTVVWIPGSLVWFAQLQLKDENRKGTSSLINDNGNKLHAAPSDSKALTPWNTRVPYMTWVASPTWQSGRYYSDGNFAELNLFIPSYTKGRNIGSLHFVQIMGVLRFLGVGIVWNETFLPAAKGYCYVQLPWRGSDMKQYKFIFREQPHRVNCKYKSNVAAQRKSRHTQLRGFSLLANYTDRATVVCRRS